MCSFRCPGPLIAGYVILCTKNQASSQRLSWFSLAFDILDLCRRLYATSRGERAPKAESSRQTMVLVSIPRYLNCTCVANFAVIGSLMRWVAPQHHGSRGMRGRNDRTHDLYNSASRQALVNEPRRIRMDPLYDYD
jgi:hypothetical protein